ncbi:MAG: hypothetical protein ACI4AK_03615 [Lepagella sp.]
MSPSPWKVFLHPRRYSRELNEALEARDNFVSEHQQVCAERDRALEDLSKMQSQYSNLQGEYADLQRSFERLKEELAKREEEHLHAVAPLKAKIEELQGQLVSQEEMERALADIDRQLDQVEEMKLRYENRITRLRAKIISLKSLQQPESSSDIAAGVIDMTTGRIIPKKNYRKNIDEDWLESLPD